MQSFSLQGPYVLGVLVWRARQIWTPWGSQTYLRPPHASCAILRVALPSAIFSYTTSPHGHRRATETNSMFLYAGLSRTRGRCELKNRDKFHLVQMLKYALDDFYQSLLPGCPLRTPTKPIFPTLGELIVSCGCDGDPSPV